MLVTKKKKKLTFKIVSFMIDSYLKHTIFYQDTKALKYEIVSPEAKTKSQTDIRVE